MARRVSLALAALTTMTAAALSSQERPLSDPARWELPDGARIVDGATGPELRITAGRVEIPGADFSTGTILFSLKVSGLPSFVGVLFRIGGGGADHVYVRPHSSGQWDAIQYQPIMNGSSTWQLYAHGNAAAPIPADRWFDVRLEVDGDHAAFYLDGSTDAVLEIPRLEGPATTGGMTLSAGFRGGGPGGVDAARVRDLVVTRRAASGSRAVAAEGVPGYLTAWRVTAPMAIDSSPLRALPEDPGAWQSITADPSGLVNFNRKFARAGDLSVVLAAVTLRTDVPRTVRLELDFSDDATVFLNSQPLYSSVNGWQSHHPLYLGALNPAQPPHAVYLPLRAGSNDLTVAVSERAFGWGLVARLADAPGVEVGSDFRNGR